eukprot:1663351-Amphidinium_carterae.1
MHAYGVAPPPIELFTVFVWNRRTAINPLRRPPQTSDGCLGPQNRTDGVHVSCRGSYTIILTTMLRSCYSQRLDSGGTETLGTGTKVAR